MIPLVTGALGMWMLASPVPHHTDIFNYAALQHATEANMQARQDTATYLARQADLVAVQRYLVSHAPPPPPVVAPVPRKVMPVAPTATPPHPAPLTFLGEAQSQIGQVNPPYSAGGFWCYLFVNYVGDKTIPGYVDATAPGDFLAHAADAAGPQPGDVALYSDARMAAQGEANYIVHVGIVERVNADGTFTAIEGNGVSANSVVETTRPNSGPGPENFQVYEFVKP